MSKRETVSSALAVLTVTGGLLTAQFALAGQAVAAVPNTTAAVALQAPPPPPPPPTPHPNPPAPNPPRPNPPVPPRPHTPPPPPQHFRGMVTVDQCHRGHGRVVWNRHRGTRVCRGGRYDGRAVLWGGRWGLHYDGRSNH